MGAGEEVDGVLYLGSKLVPNLDGKDNVSGAKGTSESILECLDSLFGSMDMILLGLTCQKQFNLEVY